MRKLFLILLLYFIFGYTVYMSIYCICRGVSTVETYVVASDSRLGTGAIGVRSILNGSDVYIIETVDGSTYSVHTLVESYTLGYEDMFLDGVLYRAVDGGMQYMLRVLGFGWLAVIVMPYVSFRCLVFVLKLVGFKGFLMDILGVSLDCVEGLSLLVVLLGCCLFEGSGAIVVLSVLFIYHYLKYKGYTPSLRRKLDEEG